MKLMPKIIQIAFEINGSVGTSEYSDEVSGYTNSTLYALWSDGTITFREYVASEDQHYWVPLMETVFRKAEQ